MRKHKERKEDEKKYENPELDAAISQMTDADLEQLRISNKNNPQASHLHGEKPSHEPTKHLYKDRNDEGRGQ